MATTDVTATVHVVLCACTEEDLVERVSRIVAEHAARCREGVVPALLAEDLVARLRAQGMVLLSEVEGID